jgi:hypothetical protein
MGEVARSARQQQCNFILSALASPTVTTITRGLVRAKHLLKDCRHEQRQWPLFVVAAPIANQA